MTYCNASPRRARGSYLASIFSTALGGELTPPCVRIIGNLPDAMPLDTVRLIR